MTASNSYTGSTTINSGGTLEFNSTSDQTLNGGLLGSGGLVQQGPGLLTVDGTNTYSGVTMVLTGGTLALGSSQALQDSTFNTNGGGVLSAGTLTAFVLGGISGSNAFTIPSGSALELGVTSGTVSVVLTGGGSLSAIGPGVVTLTNTNNYSGGTSVSGGTLAGSVASLPTAITLSNNANVTFNQNVAGTFNYPIVGTGSLTMAGTNILILTASNGYTGPTTISGGSLEFNSGSNQTLSGGLDRQRRLGRGGPERQHVDPLRH